MDSVLADGLAVGMGEGECVRKAVKGQSSHRGWNSHFLRWGKMQGSRCVSLWSICREDESLLLVILFGTLIEHPYGNTNLEVC